MIEWGVIAVFIAMQTIFFTALSWRIMDLENRVESLETIISWRSIDLVTIREIEKATIEARKGT